MFIVTTTYLKPIAEVDKFLALHRSYLQRGYDQNLLLASGPQNPRNGGIILARGTDKKRVLDFLENDPFKINGIATYSVVEFDPVLCAHGVEPYLK